MYNRFIIISCSPSWARTKDPLINSQMLSANALAGKALLTTEHSSTFITENFCLTVK